MMLTGVQSSLTDGLPALTQLPTTSGHRRAATITSLIIVAVALLILPFAHRQGIVIVGAVPAFAVLTIVANFIIAGLFAGRFRNSTVPALAVLSATYFYVCIIIIPYLLTFPGVVTPTGALGAGSQTATWLWVFWHGGCAAGLLIYLGIEMRYRQVYLASRSARLLTIGLCAGVALLIGFLLRVALQPPSVLPQVISKGNYTELVSSGVGPAIWLLTALACVGLLWRGRHGTLLQLWLGVAMLATLVDVTLSLAGGVRYSVGWYAARWDSLVGVAIVLGTLFYEINRLYAQLAESEQRVRALNNELEQRVLERTAELQSADRAKDEFMSNASHELKTPLTSLQGYVTLVKRRLQAARPLAAEGPAGLANTLDDAQELLAATLRQCSRLDRLINELLDASRIESGKLKLQCCSCDLVAVVCEAAVELTALAPARTIHLVMPEKPVPAHIDPVRIGQVVANYLTNALKYSPPSGQIEVGVRVDGETGYVWVRDEGPGVAPHEQRRIWDRAYQIDGSDRYNGSHVGLGLGLFISRTLIEHHHGTVGLESRPGDGSTFWFKIPLQPAHAPVFHGTVIAESPRPADQTQAEYCPTGY